MQSPMIISQKTYRDRIGIKYLSVVFSTVNMVNLRSDVRVYRSGGMFLESVAAQPPSNP